MSTSRPEPESEIFPAPVLDWPKPPVDKLERERLAFLSLLPDLLKTHVGQYVAIHDGKVVDTDPDETTLALRVYRTIGYIPIYIDLVASHPAPPKRIPSPRHFRGTDK